MRTELRGNRHAANRRRRGCKLIVDYPIKERNFIGETESESRAKENGLGIISLRALARIDREWYPDEKNVYREREDQIESLIDGPTLKVSLLSDFRTGWRLVYKIRHYFHRGRDGLASAYVKMIFPRDGQSVETQSRGLTVVRLFHCESILYGMQE